MRHWTVGLAAFAMLISVGQAQGSILVGAQAIAFQNEGTLSTNVGPGVSARDDIWSLTDVVPFGTVVYDYYATGLSPSWFDAISLEFAPIAGEDLAHLTFRAYLQKGEYVDNSWQHYQLLPGTFNPTNQNADASYAVGAIVHPVPLSPNTTVGWVEFDVDATAPGYTLPSGNIGLTLRLWNWRVDAVELNAVPEPCTLIVWSLLTASGVGIGWRRRRRAA